MSNEHDIENEASLESLDEVLDSDNIVVTEGHSVASQENSEETTSEEVSSEGEEVTDQEETEDTVNETNDSSEEETTEEVASEETSEEESTEEADDGGEEEYTQYLGELSDETGIELSSEEDVVAALNELYEFKTNPQPELPKEAQMVADLISSGGDYRSKLRLLSLDTENLNDKEALKEAFFLKNEVKGTQELANMQFERDFRNKYGVLDKLNSFTDPDEKAEFEAENSEEIKFAKLSYEQDVKDAKDSVSRFIEDSTTPSTEEGMTEEEMNQIYQNHVDQVNSVSTDFEGVVLPYGENGEDSFNLMISDEDRPLLQEALTNPVDYFRETVGIDIQTGQINDYNQLASVITMIQNSDKLVSVLGQYYMEQNDKKTVEEIVENREKPKTTNSKPQQEGQGISLDDDPDF